MSPVAKIRIGIEHPSCHGDDIAAVIHSTCLAVANRHFRIGAKFAQPFEYLERWLGPSRAMAITPKAQRRLANAAAVACDFCRRRKIRCALAKDRCVECLQRSLVCTFEPTARAEQGGTKRERDRHVLVWDSTARASPSTADRRLVAHSLREADSPAMLLAKDVWDSNRFPLGSPQRQLLASTLLARHMFRCALRTSPSLVSPAVSRGISHYAAATAALSAMDNSDIAQIPFVIALLDDVFFLSASFLDAS